ncbi:MAG: UDP-N-acetylmuramoyl-L-alanine--D-glutamate ligase [Tissierellia bacterium]|nr:UDP-N-acetylmuramoyl-L-alanine--D-glutamate ligase [Tissierellia bacterium]
MNLNDKNILVLGLGVSGVSTTRALDNLGANIFISDAKEENDLEEYIGQIEDIDADLYLGTDDIPLDDIDLIIKSPGIPPTIDILNRADEKGIEVITDLELAYRIKPDSNLIAITGTNGKTTTTLLTGEFFKESGIPTHIAGNIGVGILWDMLNAGDEDVFVVEASSFQLEHTRLFNPKVSLILNITSDHLDWHGNIDNYIQAKKKIFQNQDINGYTILNYDDPLLKDFKDKIHSKLIWFSVDNKLDRGIYIDDGYIIVDNGGTRERVIRVEDIRILGKHNLENALASISIGWIMGLKMDAMRKVLERFPGVEHRLEYVGEIQGISFYNDSKATNPEASIGAIGAMDAPIILIAGGQDRGSRFDDLIQSLGDKVKALILLGETSKKIGDTAIKYGFENIYIVDDMDAAVRRGYQLGIPGDSILLSPACASWDMYKSFEIRGNHFKESVNRLGEE